MKSITNKTLTAAPWVLLTTFALFFILPRQFQFITFFIPVIYSCVVFSRNGQSFNVKMLFIILVAAILFPTGFFTLDTSGDVIIAATQPTLSMVNGAMDFVNFGVLIFVFILPVGVIVWIILDIINPLSINDYESDLSTIMKMVVIIIIFFVICFVLDLFGLLPSWFFWHYIRDFILWLVQIFSFAGVAIVNFFTGQAIPQPPAFPDLGSMSLGQIINDADSLFPTLSAAGSPAPGSLPWVFVNISAAIPLALVVICAIIWFMEKRGRKPYLFINKWFGEKEDSLKIKLIKFNAPALVFGAAVLVYAFAMFLTFTDSGMDVGLYTVITAFCIILIIIGILPAKTGNVRDTLEGTLLGVGGIFFFYNMLSTGLSVIEFQDTSILVKILNQVFFTAPTESLIFHVTIPGISLLFAFYMYTHFKKRNKRYLSENQILTLQLKQARLRELYNQALTYDSTEIEYKGQQYTVSGLSTEIFNIDNDIKLAELEQQKDITISLNTLIFSKVQYTIFIATFCVIIPNIIFSTFHSFRSQYNILDFWANGLGFIYLGSGAWLTFITIRYGWLPCILSHALINIISILLLGVYV